MSKKRDPIIAVLNYFETVDPLLLPQAVALVREIARKRTPKATATATAAKKPTRRQHATLSEPAPITN